MGETVLVRHRIRILPRPTTVRIWCAKELEVKVFPYFESVTDHAIRPANEMRAIKVF